MTALRNFYKLLKNMRIIKNNYILYNIAITMKLLMHL